MGLTSNDPEAIVSCKTVNAAMESCRTSSKCLSQKEKGEAQNG